MRLLKNTLFVQTQGAYLHKDGENLVLRLDQQEKVRIPLHKLQSIITFGQISLSPYLMGHCLSQGIAITHLSEYGRFLARVEGPLSGNILLRRTQYRLYEDPARSLSIARNMITGKIYNQRYVIRRYLRDHGANQPETAERLAYVERRLTHILSQVQQVELQDTLRGREGEAAALYFGVFADLIRNEKFAFNGRVRRPPRDPINALLSFFYTLMTHECRAALESVGLDAANGFFHQPRPGRASLALDLLEEFRPVIDRFVLALINRQQVGLGDFEIWPNDAVTLVDDARSRVLQEWHKRKMNELRHEWFEENVPLGLLPWLQAQILARHLRSDVDAYVPFLWK